MPASPPSPRAGAALRCALLAMRGADRDAIEQGRLGLAGHARAAYLDAETHLTIGRCLLRLGRVDEARQHGEQAIALLARWPGRHRTRAEEFLASARGAADLTAREIEVLSCLAAGMSNKQVARCPGISIRTVTVHVSNLLRKTRSASRTEAALWAVRHRLADPPGICVRRASGSRKESASRSRERNMTQQRRPVSRRARRPDRAGTAARPR
jgi:DNA-binding NarL/FixJ family response regulator